MRLRILTFLPSVALNVETSRYDDENACTCRVAIFGITLNLSAPATSTRACLRRYLLRTVFAGENVLVSQHKRSVVLRFRRSRSSMSNGSGEPHLRVPFVPPIGPFSGDLRRSEAHARPRRDSLLQPCPQLLIHQCSRFVLHTSAGSHTVIANRDISSLYLSVRSFARTRDEQSQHSREARAGTDSRRD